MLKKTIKFTDLDDKEVTEDHYFHLSKADLVEMEVSQQGGMQTYITKIVESNDGKKIIEVFKDLIRMSYGSRTDTGRFVRDKEKTEEFMASEAYSELFMELVTNSAAAAEFVNGIIPRGLDETAAKLQAASKPPALDPTGLSVATEPRVLSQAEVAEMDSDELKSGLATGRYKLS